MPDTPTQADMQRVIAQLLEISARMCEQNTKLLTSLKADGWCARQQFYPGPCPARGMCPDDCD